MTDSLLLAPLRGAHFHPPATHILKTVGSGLPLQLQPEPSNPFDPKAIKVLVRHGDLEKYQDSIDEGFDEYIADHGLDFVAGDFWAQGADELLWLGFIAKEATENFHPVLESHSFFLRFDPAGKPTVWGEPK